MPYKRNRRKVSFRLFQPKSCEISKLNLKYDMNKPDLPYALSI
jgi:hypothetical protein